ncbi:hypothetical protein ACS3CU_001808 [Vibrio parahaemolyticus]
MNKLIAKAGGQAFANEQKAEKFNKQANLNGKIVSVETNKGWTGYAIEVDANHPICNTESRIFNPDATAFDWMKK